MILLTIKAEINLLKRTEQYFIFFIPQFFPAYGYTVVKHILCQNVYIDNTNVTTPERPASYIKILSPVAPLVNSSGSFSHNLGTVMFIIQIFAVMKMYLIIYSCIT